MNLPLPRAAQDQLGGSLDIDRVASLTTPRGGKKKGLGTQNSSMKTIIFNVTSMYSDVFNIYNVFSHCVNEQ